MLRVNRLLELNSEHSREKLATVQRIYESAFPHYPAYSAKIRRWVEEPVRPGLEVLLLLAEGRKGRVHGFALTFHYPDLHLGYLDYLVSDPARPARGIGAALYEATREALITRDARGLLCDVPSDQGDKLKEPDRLANNRRRLAFYESMGARPIVGTIYETLVTPANQGHLTWLVYDDLGREKPMRKSELRRFLVRMFESKYGLARDHAAVRKIVASVKDEVVERRPARYTQSRPAVAPQRLGVLEVVAIGDEHQIHHLKQRGYVEKPARMSAIREGLEELSPVLHKPKNAGTKLLREVHDASLLTFLKQAEKQLTPRDLLYPNVFPIRRPERRPKTWEMQAGYYCIDTFTPLTVNVYKASLRSVHSAITGAELLLDGAQSVYSLARPPGHHAERRVFGGFCYMNSAAVAVHRLSREGRVAFLDIDYHHGNGSQNIFYERSDVYFASIHGHPRQAYPYFAGFADELGEGPGAGFNRNFPLYPGADDARYLRTLDAALGVLGRFKPDFLVVSLGLDIMRGDPTGTFLITRGGMQEIGRRLGAFGRPVLVVQEGGYSLANLRSGTARFFRGLLQGQA